MGKQRPIVPRLPEGSIGWAAPLPGGEARQLEGQLLRLSRMPVRLARQLSSTAAHARKPGAVLPAPPQRCWTERRRPPVRWPEEDWIGRSRRPPAAPPPGGEAPQLEGQLLRLSRMPVRLARRPSSTGAHARKPEAVLPVVPQVGSWTGRRRPPVRWLEEDWIGRSRCPPAAPLPGGEPRAPQLEARLLRLSRKRGAALPVVPQAESRMGWHRPPARWLEEDSIGRSQRLLAAPLHGGEPRAPELEPRILRLSRMPVRLARRLSSTAARAMTRGAVLPVVTQKCWTGRR
jgi:hypothetical protein